MKRIFIVLLIYVMLGCMYLSTVTAQNTVITDDDAYSPHSSAMLDVYSLSKGLLVPRLTSAQRSGISTPADGLLVYDTDVDQYYYYGDGSWNPIDAPSLWSENSDTVFITGVGKRYGVGTASPLAKLTVQGDATIASDEPLFEVKNSEGDVIFAVYENEVKVNFKETAKGVKGGFAVGGLSGTKADPVEYMRITPDSVRIYIDDSGTKGVKGGFAVGGLSGTKGGNQYFKLDEESASIYLKQPAKGVKGGFAVGGLSGTKGTEDFLTIERDSARIYLNEATKGVKGGFAVGGLSGTKAGSRFLDLTSKNYFIGEGAGESIENGIYNIFMGYLSGQANTDGSYNVFLGYNTGKDNIDGDRNVFLGYNAGQLNTSGAYNVFLGYESGYSNDFGNDNVFAGYHAGYSNIDGMQNVFIGRGAGLSNVGTGEGTSNIGVSGDKNVFIGNMAGNLNTHGFRNVFIGTSAGERSTLGEDNVYMGTLAGAYTLESDNNVFLGSYCGFHMESDSYNTFVGARVGYDKVGGSHNTIVGASANGYTGTLPDPLDGSYNTFLGAQSGFRTSIGEENVYIGYRAGHINQTGSGNVFIGSNAGYLELGSDALYIENTIADSTGALIYGEFDNDILVFNASVGVGVEQPASDLHVMHQNNSSESGVLLENTSSNNQFRLFVASSDGNLELYTESGIVGEFVSSSGEYFPLSDKRMKTDITSINSVMDRVMRLHVVDYYFKSDDKRTQKSIGLIAQEVAEIFPSLVEFPDDEQDSYKMNYSGFGVISIKAIQEQQVEIDNLQTQVSELKKENKELRELINQIQKKLE